MTSRSRLLAVAALLSGCSDYDVHAFTSQIQVEPEVLEFADLELGSVSTELLTITNPTAGNVELFALSSDPPIAVDFEGITISPDEAAEIEVTFSAETLGGTSVMLELGWRQGSTPSVEKILVKGEVTPTYGDWYLDEDGDGFGTPADSVHSPSAPEGYVNNDRDCDDLDGEIHPDALEICDDRDNDCDARIDEDTLGSDEACPGVSCKEIKDSVSAAPSGSYWISPVADQNFMTWCEMSGAGGGWTLAGLRNSVETSSVKGFGVGFVALDQLGADPALASAAEEPVNAWIDTELVEFTQLRVSVYDGGAFVWRSSLITAQDLRVPFGEDGYYLYEDNQGYSWCGGDRLYADYGIDQVDPIKDGPEDCKGHEDLGSGWDFSESATEPDLGMSLHAGDSSDPWMSAGYGPDATRVPLGSAGAAQALWVR